MPPPVTVEISFRTSKQVDFSPKVRFFCGRRTTIPLGDGREDQGGGYVGFIG
jgi:hypothetical protein